MQSNGGHLLTHEKKEEFQDKKLGKESWLLLVKVIAM